MAEQTSESKTAKSSAVVMGIDKPFSGKEAETTAGVDNETRLFEGVHPESKVRMSVTLAGLQAEFGKELGEKKYLAIAGIGGGSVFFNPQFEATNFRPPLGIGNLSRTLTLHLHMLGANYDELLEAWMETEVLPPHGAYSTKQFLLARRWSPDYFASWVPANR